MQKKIVTLFMLSLFSVNVLSIPKIDTSSLKKLATIGCLIGLGTSALKAQQMNDQYTKAGKRPDTKMRFYKTIGTLALVAGVDIITQEKPSLSLESLAKVTAYAVSLLATTDPVARACREVPVINNLTGFLTDPVDENGNEIKDFGAIARFALLHIPVRAALINLTK